MTEEIKCHRCRFGSVPDLPGWKEPDECSLCHDGSWVGFEQTPEKYKPDYEMFFGHPYKVYCGKCERLIATLGRYFLLDDLKKEVDVCRHCGAVIDWGGEENG